MVNEKQTIEELQGLAKNEPDKALELVKKIIKEYPYFMAARILELDILKTTNQKGYKHALRACALQTTQRNVLYQHLEDLAKNVENDQQQITVPNENNLHSFLQWLELIDDKTTDRTPSKFDWIDDFLAQNAKIDPTKNTASIKDLTKENPLSKNEIMTETLAHLYWKQKKYDEAKKAFKILSLKYPEKSSLFADHIKQIKSEDSK
jgi:tetratricopeptide (TPR) repeat protein